MHLKTLTVRGFKSFAAATTFEFEPGVTAVVGPNGSGKSNVVDALAWVMGEQGAKSLRGGSMEDVIFAGTAEREPLGRASVSLTIDNSDGALPIEYSEVTISRTMFRSGGSEYTINGSKCRLLDIQELLSDSGLGREMHVIVGQGQLDQVLHATAEQRRGFIEEAAGVLKHRRRRERSVRKLESMRGNLERLEDLISEISRQLAPLGRQATVARRAQRIQHDLRDALSRIIADDLVQAATALHESNDAEQRDHRNAQDLREALAARDDQIHALNADVEALRLRVEQLGSGHHRLAQVQEKLRSVSSLAAERAASLRQAAESTTVNGRDPQELRRRAAEISAEAQIQQQRVQEATAQLDRASADRAAAEAELKAEEQRVTEQLRAVADRRAGMATLRGRVETAQGRRDAAAARQRRAVQQQEAEAIVLEASTAELAELEQRIVSMETDEHGLEGTYQQAQAQFDELRRLHEEYATEQRRLEISVTEYRAQLSGLQAARAPRDGAAALREHLDAALIGTYAEQLHVRRGWERAIAACLGTLDSALVVQDAGAAEQALLWLEENDAGRAHLVHSSSAPSGAGEQVEPERPELKHGALWALDVVDLPESLAAPVRSALTGVALAQDLASARQLIDLHAVTSAVTPDGVILKNGEHIGGTPVHHAELTITARIADLQEDLAHAERALEDKTATLQQSQSEVSTAELKTEQALEALQSNEAAQKSVSAQLERVRAEISRSQQRAAGLQTEIVEAAAGVQDADEQLAEFTARLEAAQRQETTEDPSTAQRDQLGESAAAARRDEVDARLALRAAEDQHRQLLERAGALLRSAETEEQRREQAQRAARMRNQKAEQAQAVGRESDDAVARLEAQLQRVQSARAAAGAQLGALREKLVVLQQRRTTDAAALEQALARLHQVELQQTELRLALESAEMRGQDELSLTPEYLIEHYGPDQPVPDLDDAEGVTARPYLRAEQQSRLAQARRDLKALGKVNPLALEEHAALQQRHRYLQEQLNDLKQSRQALLDLIADVDATVQQVFAEAWEDTRVQFERVFARLFPGGEGRLELTNPEDMLNTGVEVHARPPGKRIRRLSLLSGGERSLTAVALLVAIFKARPSPFYVMDEVEAALDDTNLSRLLVIFEELRESSQLIVITHQKRTMEIADALYGVSMRQDGSTRVISQRLARGNTAATADVEHRM